MKIKTGIDIVYLPRFRKSLKVGGQKFLQRVFLPQELEDQRIERLAGIFAAKEAMIKALDLPKDSWQDIHIVHNSDGTPLVKSTNHYPLTTGHSLSISHDGNYVIAQFVIIIKN